MRNLWNRGTSRKTVASLAVGLSLSVAATFLGNAVAPQIATAAPAQKLKVDRIPVTPMHTYVIPQAADILGGFPNSISGGGTALTLRPQGAFFTETEFPRTRETLGGIEYSDDSSAVTAAGYRDAHGIIMRLRSNPAPIRAKISRDDTQPSTWNWSGWRIFYRQYDQETKTTSQWRTCTPTGANALLITGSSERDNLICPNSGIHYELKGGHIQYGLALAYTTTKGDKRYLAWSSIELNPFVDYVYPAFYFDRATMESAPPPTRANRFNVDARTLGLEISDAYGIGFTSRRDLPRLSGVTVTPLTDKSFALGFPGKQPSQISANPSRYAIVAYYRLSAVDQYKRETRSSSWQLCSAGATWEQVSAERVLNAGPNSPERTCNIDYAPKKDEYFNVAVQVVDLWNGNVGNSTHRIFKGLERITQEQQDAFDKVQRDVEEIIDAEIAREESNNQATILNILVSLAAMLVAGGGPSLAVIGFSALLSYIEELLAVRTFNPVIATHMFTEYDSVKERVATKITINGLGKEGFLKNFQLGYRTLELTCKNNQDTTDIEKFTVPVIGKRGLAYNETAEVTLDLKQNTTYTCTAATENSKNVWSYSPSYDIKIDSALLTGLSISSITETVSGVATISFTAAEPSAQRTYSAQYRVRDNSGNWGKWESGGTVSLSAEQDTGTINVPHTVGEAREYRIAAVGSSGINFYSNVAPFSIGTTRLPENPFAKDNIDTTLTPPKTATAKVRPGISYLPGSSSLVPINVEWSVTPPAPGAETPLYAVYVKELRNDNAPWKPCSGLRGETTTDLTASCGIDDDRPYIISVHSARPGVGSATLSKPVVILFDPLLMQKDTSDARAAQAGSEQLLTFIYSDRQMVGNTNYANIVNSFNRIADSAAKAGRAAYETRMMEVLAKIADMIPQASVAKPQPLTNINGNVKRSHTMGESSTELAIDYETPTFTDLSLPRTLEIKCSPTGSSVGTAVAEPITVKYPQGYRQDTQVFTTPKIAGNITCSGYTTNTGAGNQEQVSDGLTFDIFVSSTNLTKPRISTAEWNSEAPIVDVRFLHSLLDDTATYRIQARVAGDSSWLNGEPKTFSNIDEKGTGVEVERALEVVLDSRTRWEIRVQATNAAKENLRNAVWTSSDTYALTPPEISAPRSGLYTYTDKKKHLITWKSPQFPEIGDSNVSYHVHVIPSSQTSTTYVCTVDGAGIIAAGQPRQCEIDDVLVIGAEYRAVITPFIGVDLEKGTRGHPLVFKFVAGSSGVEETGDVPNGVIADYSENGETASKWYQLLWSAISNGITDFYNKNERWINILGVLLVVAVIAVSVFALLSYLVKEIRETLLASLKPTKPTNLRVTSNTKIKDDTVAVGEPLPMMLSFNRSRFPTEDQGRLWAALQNYGAGLLLGTSSWSDIEDTTEIEKKNIRYVVNCRIGEGENAPRLGTRVFTAEDAPGDTVEMAFDVRRTTENSDEKITCDVTPTLWGSSAIYRLGEEIERTLTQAGVSFPLVGQDISSLFRKFFLSDWKEENFTGETASGTSKTLGWESVRGDIRSLTAFVRAGRTAEKDNYNGAEMRVTWSKLTRPDAESKDDTVIYFIDVKPRRTTDPRIEATGAIRYDDADLKRFNLSAQVVERDDASLNQTFTFTTGALQTLATISPVEYLVTVYAAIQSSGEAVPDLAKDKTSVVASQEWITYPFRPTSTQSRDALRGAAQPITGEPKQDRSIFTRINVPFRLGYMPSVTSGTVPFTGKVGAFCSPTSPANTAFWDDTTLPAKLTSLRQLTLDDTVAKNNSNNFVLYNPRNNSANFLYDDTTISPGTQRFCQHIFTNNEGRNVVTEPQEVLVESRSPAVEIVQVVRQSIFGWTVRWKKPVINEMDESNGILGYEVRVRRDSGSKWRTIATRASIGLQSAIGNATSPGDYGVFISAIGLKRNQLRGHDVTVVAITSTSRKLAFDHKSFEWWIKAFGGFAAQWINWEIMPTTEPGYRDGNWVEVSLPLHVHKLRR